MLTGLRSHDARSMRWENLDADGVLHVPEPKGGRTKAFDLPLCTYYLRMELDCLPRHSEWVFPARRPYFKELRRVPEFDHNPHSMRRLYRTMRVEAGVEFTMAKLLLNHSMAGDISFRYVSRAQLLGPMREASEERLEPHRGLGAGVGVHPGLDAELEAARALAGDEDRLDALGHGSGSGLSPATREAPSP